MARSADEGEQSPGAGDALELVLASVIELDAWANHQVLDGSGDEDFAFPCQAPYPRGYVNGQTAEVVSSDLAFAGMNTGAYFQIDPSDGLDDCFRTSDGSGWTIESDHEAVSGRFDLTPSEPPQLVSYQMIVGVQ
jgi:hypothetical protein